MHQLRLLCFAPEPPLLYFTLHDKSKPSKFFLIQSKSRGDIALTKYKNQLRALEYAAPQGGYSYIQAPEGAQDMALYTAAAKAARVRDLKAHVVTADGKK